VALADGFVVSEAGVITEGSRTRVLLVEDHVVNQKVVTRMLERLGCVVELAEDGLVGVERVCSRPSLVLMDCSMPRCDGYEATRRIRALPGEVASTPIVALTAHATPADRDRCLASGMDDWLAKPVSPNDLVGVLRKYTHWTLAPTPPLIEGILDRRIVGQLVALGGEEDPEFFTALVEEFRSTADSALFQARSLHATESYVEVRRTVHRLKSASATIGAVRLREACARLESADDTDLATHGETWIDLAEHEVGLATVALAASGGV
jgi:CheY-like chemotaxis protein